MASEQGLFALFINKAIASGRKELESQLQDAGRNLLLKAVGGSSSLEGMILRSLLKQSGAEITAEKRDARTRARKIKRGRLAHQVWLRENSWRFDWRSQPRRPAGTEAGGEWMPGRLDYPVGVKSAVSRSQRRQQMRSVRAYKQRMKDAGHTQTRIIRSSWGDF